MPPKLSYAIAAVYAAFAGVRKPQTIDGCPCCIDEKKIPLLLAKPLREISADELSPYAASVFLTVGSEEDFRYFLPRILEIAATDSGWWPDPEVIARALIEGNWPNWRKEERAAVSDFFAAVFDETLRDPEYVRMESWLCATARGGFDVTRCLSRIESLPGAVLDLYAGNANAIAKNQLSNGFWDDCPEGRRQVLAWFHSASVRQVIFEAYGVELPSM